MTTLAPVPQTALPRTTGWLALTASEARLQWREPAGVIIPLGLPLLILVMNGMGAKAFTGAGPRTFDTIATPVVLAMIVAITALTNLPAILVAYRKTGVLRRMSATPVSPVAVLAAQVLVNLALTAIGITLALTVATLAFDLSAPAQPLAVSLALLLGTLANYALGLVIAALAPSTNGAIGIGMVAFFGTFAAGGGFLPAERLPRWLAQLGEHTPFGAALHAMRDSWTGTGPSAYHLVLLGVLTAVLSAIAVRTFRWT